MKQMIKISLLAVGAAMVTQALQAQISDGDLVIGFNSSSVGSDYVIDLGQVPSAANTQLGGSISLSTYNTTYGANLVNVGVVAGDQSGIVDPSGGESAWTTTLRTGTAATSYASAGTETAPGVQTASAVDSMASLAESVALGVTGTSTAQQTAWNQVIAKGPGQTGANSLNYGTYANPMAALSSQPLTLDLWSITDDSGINHWTYDGDLQINLTGASPSVVFDPAVVAVPEPTTYGLLAGGGLLALALRRQFSVKNA
jgi:hypothetical protein